MKYKTTMKHPYLKTGLVLEVVGASDKGDIVQTGRWIFPVNHDITLNRYGWYEPVIERWKPVSHNAYYYCVNTLGQVKKTTWGALRNSDIKFDVGNMFETEVQAKEAARRVKQTLMDYHKELNE